MNDITSQATQMLLRQARGGDAQALDALLRHAGDRLSALAHRMLGDFTRVRRWAETGDVLQNSLVRLMKALRDVQPESPRDFFALAAVQIRRELIDLVRHFHGPNGAGANQESVSPERREAIEPADGRGQPLSLIQWGEMHEQIAALPEEERAVVELVFYQGLTQAEAAEILDVSLRTLQRRWHAALLKLHRAWHGGANGDLR